MNNMTLRDLLMQAAAMAVMAVRENRYPGPAVIADDILAETPEVMAWRERVFGLRSQVENMVASNPTLFS